MYLIHKINKFTTFSELKIVVFCFKQLPEFFKQIFEASSNLIFGEILLPSVIGVIMFSVNKPLDFQA